MNIIKLTNKLKAKALSNDEMMELVSNKARLLTYSELTKYNDIDTAMGKHKAIILLYLTKSNYGHWTCLFKRDKNTVECFDSYGIKPDDELKFIPENFRKVSHQVLPHLTALLYKSGYKVIYNDKKLQKRSSSTQSIATCGRHVCMRLILRELPLNEYIALFKGVKYDPDTVVTLLTNFL